ncbi:DUF1573 domain-containing protein [Candidatus Omnitrophota bacterium]
MKKIFFVLLCFYILTNNVNAFSLEDSNRGKVLNLESNNLEYDLGSIERDEIKNETIEIRNRLDESLVITEARSICECVKIYVKPQIVGKGEIFEVEFTLDSTGIKHDIEEVVYILTENMNYELIRFVILADMIDFELILVPIEDNLQEKF